MRLLIPLLAALVVAGAWPCQARTVIDALGRELTLPDRVERVLCSGPGCLRLLTYLQAQQLAVAVDSIEKRANSHESRPYALANPQFQQLPLFGEHRGRDNPELIAGLSPRPQVVFKTYPGMGLSAQLLQDKTGIPVVALGYGNLTWGRKELDTALRLMGLVVDRQERAEAVIAFLDEQQRDLEVRSSGVPESAARCCYVGGIAMRGGHGFQSTDPSYAPFALAGARNVASGAGRAKTELSHASVAREQILAWNPDTLFLDLSTLQLGPGVSGLDQLRTDPAYAALDAVRAGRVYGVLPYNSYTQNFGSILADAYFVGKTLYPKRFADVDPAAKADEIYVFLVDAPVFKTMKAGLQGLAFEQVRP